MATAEVRLDVEGVLRNISRIAERYPKAIVRAANRAAVSAKAELARAVAADMKLKVSTVKDDRNLRIHEATLRDPNARIRATTRRIPLIEFRSSGPRPSKGRGRVRAMGKTYPNAFIATVGKGRHEGIFTRSATSSRRSKGAWSRNLPIAELKGPSIWQSARTHRDSAQAKGLESLRKNVIHELRFVLSQGT